jgi:hypothetical protein
MTLFDLVLIAAVHVGEFFAADRATRVHPSENLHVIISLIFPLLPLAYPLTVTVALSHNEKDFVALDAGATDNEPICRRCGALFDQVARFQFAR